MYRNGSLNDNIVVTFYLRETGYVMCCVRKLRYTSPSMGYCTIERVGVNIKQIYVAAGNATLCDRNVNDGVPVRLYTRRLLLLTNTAYIDRKGLV